MKHLKTLAIALPLVSSVAFAQDAFETFDENDDGLWDYNEFNSFADDEGVFDDWDADSDGNIGDDEFTDLGLDNDLGAYDGNSDGYLDEDEAYQGVFEGYDENENAHWEDNEWDDAGDAGLFDV